MISQLLLLVLSSRATFTTSTTELLALLSQILELLL
jgi:hypothetical protein